jgi:excisionase family DNA binding protein
MDKLLTPKEAAAHAGVSVSLIYQWCDERRLTHFRAGGKGKRGKILVSPRDLDALMESVKVEATGVRPR